VIGGFVSLGSVSSSNATFFFLDGKAGWTAPTWLKFKTEVWLLPEPSLNNFSTDKAVYTAGMFSDVNENSWYGENAKGVVGTAVRLGIMDGLGSGKFAPSGNITIAQAIKMAVVVHSIYNGGYETLTQGVPWYKVYVDYAIANGIIKYGDFADYNKTATRAEVAYIFAHAIPESELAPLNDVKSIPDVAISDRYGDEIFLLYRAGVFQGNDAAGSFSPNKYITRAEAAAIISRVALPVNRIVSQ
jgi:hypothetical protein